MRARAGALDRLLDGDPRPPYRAQDFVRSGLVGASLREVLGSVGGELYDPVTRRGHFIFYNVGPLERHGKFDVISIGENSQDAERGLLELLPARLGQ